MGVVGVGAQILVTVVFVLILATLIPVCWIFWRAAKRDRDAEAQARADESARGVGN